MPKAIRNDTTRGAEPAPAPSNVIIPTGAAAAKWVLPPDQMTATIGRLERIAAEAGDHLLVGDGPPQPDHRLLALCAEALHWRQLYDVARARRSANNDARFEACRKDRRLWSDAERAAHDVELETQEAHEKAMKRVIFQAKKMRATTGAGIYAKALIVRSTQTGAALLAMSLAEDLIACPGLRESLWPASPGGEDRS